MNPQVLLAYGSPVAAALPRRWAEALAVAAGDVGVRVLPGARAAVDANLQQALGTSVPPAVRRDVFRNYALYYLNLMRLAHLPLEPAVGRVHLHGASHLNSTLARGRGALLLGAHLGNWDVAGAALARRFGTLTTYAEPLQPPRLQRFYTDLRARLGVRALLVGSRDRAAIEVLRRNGILGLLVDRVYGERRVAVPFGHGTLLVPTGGIRLGLRAGAGIHAFFPLRAEAGFRIAVGGDLAAASRGQPTDERVRQVAAAFAAALGRVVQRHPSQWCLLQPLRDAATAALPAIVGAAPARAMVEERG